MILLPLPVCPALSLPGVPVLVPTPRHLPAMTLFQQRSTIRKLLFPCCVQQLLPSTLLALTFLFSSATEQPKEYTGNGQSGTLDRHS